MPILCGLMLRIYLQTADMLCGTCVTVKLRSKYAGARPTTPGTDKQIDHRSFVCYSHQEHSRKASRETREAIKPLPENNPAPLIITTTGSNKELVSLNVRGPSDGYEGTLPTKSAACEPAPERNIQD